MRHAWMQARAGVCLALCLLPAGAAAQPAAGRHERAVLERAARAIIDAVRYAVLVTVDDTGAPQARTMDTFAPDERFAVWFATNPRSRKVAQLERDPRVALHYYDARAPELGYVTIRGRARLVRDAAERQRRWKPGWEAFWPNRDESFLLVEVTPERIEVFSPRHGIEADPVTWAPAGANLVPQK